MLVDNDDVEVGATVVAGYVVDLAGVDLVEGGRFVTGRTEIAINTSLPEC